MVGFAVTQGGSDEVLAHSHSSREGLQSHAVYTHASDCSLAYLQSPLQRGTLSEPLPWHARFHLGCVKYGLVLRFRGVAKNYGTRVQEGHPLLNFLVIYPPKNLFIITLHAHI